jgi:hypothetical protein
VPRVCELLKTSRQIFSRTILLQQFFLRSHRTSPQVPYSSYFTQGVDRNRYLNRPIRNRTSTHLLLPPFQMASTGPGSLNPSLVEAEHKDSKFYIEDGDIVLSAKDREKCTTYFRLHRNTLARHSPIFADMFAMPLPPTTDHYEGSPGQDARRRRCTPGSHNLPV